ncbi:hypothetical protein JQ628_12850 [Bradyrhizobium lablabi]|uniref:hypothetical protein n=1 Tax=Bradyrhizobium lablabi TaxID=722472 RepID=UPI001BA54FE6|nr:hypothetical protein [Bradyrhizobium lablabi]MBR1122407.1 hypothetical protein [Bradyrhizobium lablabi]
MKSLAAKFVSAIFATVLAGSSVYAAPETEEKEKPADTCLLGPSASTPPGGHWYYRRDSANKRNCWYLGDAKGEVKGEAKGKAARKQAAEEEAAAPEKPVAPPKKPTAQRSVTDARAEWSSQTPVEPESKAAATPWPTVAPADAQRTEEPRKVATTRWPEPAAASPPAAVAAPIPPAQTQPQVAQSQPQIAQAQTQTQATPVAPPRPAVPPPAAKPTAAKANAVADQPMSLPMLLTVLVAGLSVIGVLVSAMFGRKKSRPTRLSRSAPMPSLEEVQENPRPQPQQPRPEPARSEQPRPEQARPERAPPEQPRPEQPDPAQARTPDDPTERLKEMLAEIQRRAAA